MKSASVAAAAAVLVGMSSAQPHGHHGHHHLHAKRDLVTEWETVWETVTVLVDESTTETIYPTPTGSGAPGEFFEPPTSTPSSTPTSTPEPEPTTVAEPTSTSSEAPPPPPPTTTAVTTSSSSSKPPPAPTTTSTPEPAPAPEPETTSVQTSAAPAETPSSGSGSTYAGSDKFGTSSLDSKKYSGDITYYETGLGACGYDDAGTTEHIVAISHLDWYSRGSGTSLGIDMPNHPWCDQTITITADGKSTTALVHDICPSCASGSIDVSDSVFMALFGSLEAGRTQASWSFN